MASRSNFLSVAVTGLALAGLTMPACGDGPAPDVIEGWSCEYQDILFSHHLFELDLLLVVDTAPAMAPYHAALVDNLTRFASVLRNASGGLPSIHIGVIDGAGDGRLLAAATVDGCPTPDGRFLSDLALPWWQCSEEPSQPCRDANYDAPLADVLSCLGGLDADGDHVTPLAAAIQALDGSRPDNQGFLREHSQLAVLFLTAADDDSPGAIDDYADQLIALAGDPGRLALAAVMPQTAARMRSFLDRFPQRSTMTAIERADWSDALILMSGPFDYPCCSNCLHEVDPTDIDSDQPGLQLDCWVNNLDAHDAPAALVPPCTMLTPGRPAPDNLLPCWWVEQSDDPDCPLLGHLERREAYTIRAEMRCAAICPDPEP